MNHRVKEYYFDNVSSDQDVFRHASDEDSPRALCGKAIEFGVHWKTDYQAPKCQKCLGVIHSQPADSEGE